MDQPLVSISIFSYNNEAFIDECLLSTMNQDYPNFEVIISDDASTDKTIQIIQKYQKKYPDLIKLYINSSNQGITKNANRSLENCSGKYVAFLGADDIMLPKKISKQVHYMESRPECSICYHDAKVFFQNLKQKSYLHRHAVKPREGDLQIAIKYSPFNAGCATMVRRDKLPFYGYDERLKFAADGLLWVEILENGGEIHYMNEVLSGYRIHENNATQSKHAEIALDFMIHQSKLLIKYPQHSSHILANYANSFFMMAKSNPNSIRYLKISFKIKKRFGVLFLIILHYASFGKWSFNSNYLRKINKFLTKIRIYFYRFSELLSAKADSF